MLRFGTWANLATADQMIGSAATMERFPKQGRRRLSSRAQREFGFLENFLKSKDAGALPLALSDSGYWSQQYRRTDYNFDSQSVRPYFTYEAVEKGVLNTAAHLFHLEFRPVANAPVWDPVVHAKTLWTWAKSQDAFT